MGRQKQLIVLLEDSVLESVWTGDQIPPSGGTYTACDMANQRSRVQIGAAGSTPSARTDAFRQIFLEHGIEATMGKGFLAVVAYDAFGGGKYDD